MQNRVLLFQRNTLLQNFAAPGDVDSENEVYCFGAIDTNARRISRNFDFSLAAFA